jgi:hypothetical protein
MRLRDKPATPTPSRLFGLLLLVGGGVFIGDFFWSIATYSPSITAAPMTDRVVLLSGMIAGSLLVGIGMAAMLHSSGTLRLPTTVKWEF